MLDFAPSEPLDVHARDFLLAGALLAAEADLEGMGPDEWGSFVDVILPVSADPEAEVTRVASLDEAELLRRDSAAYLRANAGPERYDLLRAVAHVAAADGVLHDEERAFLYRAAELLDIPRRAADEVAFDVLADSLQVGGLRGLGAPRPKLPRRAAKRP